MAGATPDIASALVLERGKVVASYVRTGVDPGTPLQIYSCTKNWVGLMTGIAMDAGLLSLDDTLGDIFIDDIVWNNMTEVDHRKNVTIYELLTMTSGLIDPGSDWWFTVPAEEGGLAGGGDLASSLSWPHIGPKGTFDYLALSTILTYVLQERASMSPREYLDAEVLPALGIDSSSYGWWQNQDGMEYAYHGMQLTALQMAKFGQLFLQNGLAAPGHRQLVSQNWIHQATKGQVKATLTNPLDPTQVIDHVAKYGYFFFVYNDDTDDKYYCAEGGYGQDICVHPTLQRVSIQQRDGEIDPVGNLITTPVAFDKSVSFTSSLPKETTTTTTTTTSEL